MSSRLGPRTTRAPAAQPGADGDVAVPREHRGDERHERVERGGQVDVHVGDHLGRAGLPGAAQRVAATLAGQDHGLHPLERGGQALGHQRGAVGAAVVDDRDQRREGEGLVRGTRAACRCAPPAGGPRCTRARRSRPGSAPGAPGCPLARRPRRRAACCPLRRATDPAACSMRCPPRHDRAATRGGRPVAPRFPIPVCGLSGAGT